MAATATAEAPARGPMTPVPYRVVSRAPETADTWTLLLEPLAEPVVPAPGQFNMLYAFGVGEVPISTSASPDANGALVHTIRDVGAVSHALVGSGPGTVIGVRGPYGTTWPLEQARGRDLVIVAGGIGLAPLRPAVYHALAPPRRVLVRLHPRRRADAGRPALRARARGLARPLRRRRRRHGRQRGRGLARPRRRRHAARARGHRSTRPPPSPSSAAPS